MATATTIRARSWLLSAVLVPLTLLTGCGTPAATRSTATPTPLPSPRDPESVQIHGISMAPLLTNGDTAVVDRAAYKAANPQRGDVVLLVSPENPSKLFVKLIIGVPGDELKVDGRYTDPAHPNDLPHAAVLIRPGTAGPWEILVEPYLPNQKTDPWTEMSNCCTADGRASGTPESIPLLGEDYWVLGDNRNYSADSRSFGIVAPEEILGKVFYRERGGTTTWIYAATPLLLPTG